MFENDKECLFNDKILKSEQRFKSDCHEVYTEDINKITLSSNDDKRLETVDQFTTYRYGSNTFKVCEKITLSSNDDKRLQTVDQFTTYRYGSNVFKVCESEIMIVRDYFVENYADCLFYDEIILRQR